MPINHHQSFNHYYEILKYKFKLRQIEQKTGKCWKMQLNKTKTTPQDLNLDILCSCKKHQQHTHAIPTLKWRNIRNIWGLLSLSVSVMHLFRILSWYAFSQSNKLFNYFRLQFVSTIQSDTRLITKFWYTQTYTAFFFPPMALQEITEVWPVILSTYAQQDPSIRLSYNWQLVIHLCTAGPSIRRIIIGPT